MLEELELSPSDGGLIVRGLGVANAFFGVDDGGSDISDSVDGVTVLILPGLIGLLS